MAAHLMDSPRQNRNSIKLSDVVSDHAVIRWLERIDGLDMEKIRQEAIIVTGSAPQTDKDLLRYMRAYHRLDTGAIRKMIATESVITLIDRGLKDIPIKNRRFRLKVHNGIIITVYAPAWRV